MKEETGHAVGGRARAKAMTPERRREVASKAAAARWAGEKPLKIISGSSDRPIRIGDVAIECYVLEDGSRVLSQGGVLTALGRSRRISSKPGDDLSLPPILRAQAIRPFVSDELIEKAKPIAFTTPQNQRANGYRAEILPLVCEAWLEARANGAIHRRQEPIAQAAEIIVRGLARVGIIALVDEATGYQETRARDALAKILEAYVAKELQPWVKTFDIGFYKEMFRLRGVPFDPESVKRPGYFGHLTNDVVYKRIAPGVLDEIKAQKAIDGSKKNAKFHQHFTTEVGHPKLREHITSVKTIMRLSEDWGDFKSKLDRLHPKYQNALQDTLWDDDDSINGL